MADYNTSATYTGNGAQTAFVYSAPLDYPDQSLLVFVDSVEQVEGLHYTIAPGFVNFVDPPGNGLLIVINRETPVPVARQIFYQGSHLTYTNLMENFNQALAKLQELNDSSGTGVLQELVDQASAFAQLALTYSQNSSASADEAALEAVAAAASAVAAAVSETNAQTHAATALGHANTALAQASAAAASAGAAGTAQTAAEAARTAAQAAQAAALGHANAAANSAISAVDSADAAASQALDASGYAASTAADALATAADRVQTGEDRQAVEDALANGPVLSIEGRSGIVTLGDLYLGINAQAYDSARLGGLLPAGYALATHSHAIADVTGLQTALNAKLGDAPSDGSQYVRRNGAWEVNAGGGGGDYLPLTGGTLTGGLTIDGTGEAAYTGTLRINDSTGATLALWDDVGTNRWAVHHDIASTELFYKWNGQEQAKLTSSGEMYVVSDIVAGKGGGSVALTLNDGGGNANVTFNHKDMIPDVDGNVGRIVVNVDGATNCNMAFQGASGRTVAAGANGASVMATMYADSGDFVAVGDVSAYSDMRLKEDVVVIADALQKVLSLGGYTYTRKDTGLRQSGVLAQEVQKVLPEVVGENEDGILNVSYGNMVGLLIEAIKELKQELEELKNGTAN